jgi:phosphonopyruvate decarboxylase
MIEMRDAMRVVVEHRSGDVVLTTETSIGAWAEVSDDVTLDLALPTMSKGSSMALGVALAQPNRRVIVWDGDGCLLMNMGTLVTIAGEAPKNLYHIILDNGMYAMTGGQPIPNQGNVSFAGLAKAAGYARTFEFDDLEEWTTSIGDVLREDGPVLVVMKTAPEITDWRNNPPGPSRPMREAAPVAREALQGGKA